MQTPALPLTSNGNNPYRKYSKERHLMTLPLAIGQLSPRNRNFPRNLMLGAGKGGRWCQHEGEQRFRTALTACQTTLQEGRDGSQAMMDQ